MQSENLRAQMGKPLSSVLVDKRIGLLITHEGRVGSLGSVRKARGRANNAEQGATTGDPKNDSADNQKCNEIDWFHGGVPVTWRARKKQRDLGVDV